MITLSYLKRYWEEDLLHSYYSPLKGFVDTHNFSGFSTFIHELSVLIARTNERNYILHYRYILNHLELQQACQSESLDNCSSNSLESTMEGLDKSGASSRAKNKKVLDYGPTSSSTGFSQKIMKLIEQDISKGDNFFFKLTETFGDILHQKYEEKLNCFEKEFRSIQKEKKAVSDEMYDSSFGGFGKGRLFAEEKNKNKLRKEVESTYQQAKLDITRFQSIVIDILEAFISQMINPMVKEEVAIPRESLEQLTLGLIFGKNKCYNTYFELVKYYVADEERLLGKTIEKLKNYTPKDFSVEPHFCLDNVAVPYHEVIECLQYLDVYTNPYDKFATISQVRKEILKSIETYWSSQPSEVQASRKLELSADALMPIYCYCLVNSANEKLKRHQVFMEDFLGGDSLEFGEKAYYFMTFIGAINYIISLAEGKSSSLKSLPNSCV